MNLHKTVINGNTFWATKAQANALETLMSTAGGQIAVIHDYISTSGRVSPETADITFLSRFDYSKLLKRKIDAIEKVSLLDDAIVEGIKANSKLVVLADNPVALAETFAARKASLIESAEKTLSGDRSDARRQAHDRVYLKLANGIRLHYKTFKDADGVAQVVEMDGIPVVESIKLGILQLSKRVKVEGPYKPVNSGAPVLLGQLIEKQLPKSVKYKELTLSDGKFSSLSIDGNTMLSEDFKGIF